MAFREISVNEIREVLRLWLGTAALPAPGLRTIADHAGVDRKTVRRYVDAAQSAGLTRDDTAADIDDELIAAVVDTVRPDRPHGHGAAWEQLIPHEEQITRWVAGDGEQKPLTITKIEVLLARQGCVVPYRTLHRFATERCGFGRKDLTVRVVDGDPGVECQVDFGYLGMLTDPEDGRARKVHALIFTAVYSRHMFVWLTYSQTLAAVIAGCEAAWKFFGGAFAVLIPDNLKPVVTAADPITPHFSDGWLDYSSHVGFVTDPARIRSPKDKPRVERTVQYVRGNFWAGERFTDLAEAQDAVVRWCSTTAGMRIHGTTCARPLDIFDAAEQPMLLPMPAIYDVPIFKDVKVHRDFHAEVGRALYSLPQQWIGSTLSVRADTELVKFYHRGTLVKIHPRKPAGGRSTDRADLPEHKSDYALRDVTSLIAKCTAYGPSIGIYAERILDDPLPWTRIRSVYRLQGLVRRYGGERVEQACSLSLDLDVVSVTKIASMLERATEKTSPDLPKAVGHTASRFSRDPSEFNTAATTPALSVVGDSAENTETHR
ncbi:IS21 family transposase [Rhodococcus zopfii]|uniref:IS21 family transposase n=1 Tax=Rhodococcus zopfii TaxID=43772 RepID=A0ABU3WV13_9NOCA|nr:IS21 family transposase [Rhodococcus zopfii]MDV2474784.1 IS21 family transposase [Rhodococcus zopfii]MDV2475264.1 IS21 family transposase [Rhodococcus zopfii]MDV2476792.1 IS21 family transposase [Rhodococcus zopfii]MDV2477335.1 IS21 family transposase [Rhodococcus zopfii]